MMKTTTTAQQLDNANPLVKTTASMSTVSLRKRAENERSNDDNTNAKKKRDPIDAYEIFSHIKDVNDPALFHGHVDWSEHSSAAAASVTEEV